MFRETLARKIDQKRREGDDVINHSMTFDLPTPMSSLGRKETSRSVRAAAGYRHSLLCNAKGEVRAFGEGVYGQLGLGLSKRVGTGVDAGGGMAEAEDAGASINPLGIETPRRVYFPGDPVGDDDGCDGDGGSGGTGHAHHHRKRSFAKGGARAKYITDVAVGDGTSFAITGSGELYSWGRGRYGCLGHGGEANESIPRLVERFDRIRVKQVACGRWHCLLLTKTGSIFSWGRNHCGQLGLGIDVIGGHEDAIRRVELVAESETPLAVSAGEKHSVALVNVRRADNTMETTPYAWGSMENGRLGYVNPARRCAPQEVGAVSKLLRKNGLSVTAISAGGHHTLAVTNRGCHIISWGAGGFGQLGYGHIWDRPNPVLLQELNSVLAVSAGYRHSLCVVGLTTATGFQGKLWAWGANSYGELGTGNSNICLQPVPILALNGTQVTAIAAGERHSIVLTPGQVKKGRYE